jgi:hypothetical protein
MVTAGGVLSGTRRVIDISEISGENKLNHVFTWDSATDTFKSDLKSSILLNKVADDTGRDIEEVLEEFARRVMVLRWMIEEGIHDYRTVSSIVRMYYQNPEEVLQKINAVGEMA